MMDKFFDIEVKAEPPTLRQAAQQALEAMESIIRTGDVQHFHLFSSRKIIPALRAALAEPERKPLNEDQMNEAYICIWRNLPSGFGHTASEWVDVGVRYAERAHGIGCAASGCNYPEGECLGVCNYLPKDKGR